MMDVPHPAHRPADPRQAARTAVRNAPWRELRELPTRSAKRITAAALLLALSPAHAQQPAPAPAASEPTPYQRAIAAGYKAAMLCSGIFNAGRTEAQVEALELRGIYPEYDAIVPTLKATVRRDPYQVEVDWSDTLPPRWARYEPGRGCVTYPIGTQPVPGLPDARSPEPVRPGPDPRSWPVGDATTKSKPTGALSSLVGRSFDRRTYGAGETVGVVILRGGKIVAERYRPGFGAFTSNRTWSVAKSLAGALVGVASLAPPGQRTAPFAVDKPALVLPWQTPGDPRAAITLDQLLRMTSGLHGETAGNRTDAVYFGGATVEETAVAAPLEVKPGTRFRYANNDILLAVYAARWATLDRHSDFARRKLFAKLNMAHTLAETDWQGNYILSSQVWSTARDLARFGQFLLQDGVWQGERLLPEGWVRYMTTPSGPQPASGPGYGATLWLFGPKQGLPAGSYAAQGNRGQYVMVIPSERLVIVRRGEDPGAARFDIARFAADVIEATR